MTRFQTTKIFYFLEESDKRISVFQGGSRSGKTYNIIFWWIQKLLKERNKTLTICRETYTAIKNTVFLDFKDIMERLGLWNDAYFSKGDFIYRLGTNVIQFRNLDDDQKIRGAKRDYLFINEANEIKLPIWKQLLFRTSDKIVLDYNPSDEFHWIYDEVIPREDSDFHKSTYKDNPFLPETQVKEIERLKEVDLNYWRIYGLGERGVSEASIYTNWELWKKEEPEGETYYGLDFGYNHPTALVKIVIFDGGVYAKELLYKSGMTTQNIIDELKSLNLGRSKIFGDSSRPEIIQEIYRAGFNIHPTIKGQNSVKQGIDYIKRHKLFVDVDSFNLLKELKSYKWKVDKDGRILDEPVKINDDAVDALRYAFNDLIKPKNKLLVGRTSLF